MSMSVMAMTSVSRGAGDQRGSGRVGGQRGRWCCGAWTLACAVLVCVFLASFPQAVAQKHKDMYGVVNFQKVLVSVPEGIRARKDIESQIKIKQKELQDEKAKLDELAKDFDATSSVLSEEARRQKSVDIQKKIMEFRQQEVAFQQEVRENEARMVRGIEKKVLEIVSQMAKERGLDVVFEFSKAGVMYVDPDKLVDLTDDVILQFSQPSTRRGESSVKDRDDRKSR